MGGVVGTLEVDAQALGDEIQVLLKGKVEVEYVLAVGEIAPIVIIVVRGLGLSYRNVRIGSVLDELAVHKTRAGERNAPHHGPPEVLVLRFHPVAETSSDVEFQQSCLGEVHVHIAAVVEPVVTEVGVVGLIVLLEHTVLMHVAQRHEIAEALPSSGEGDIVLGLPGIILEDFLLPVYIREHDRLISKTETLGDKVRENQVLVGHPVRFLGFSVESGIGVAVHTGQLAQSLGESELAGHRDAHLLFCTSSGGHQNHSVSTPHSEYSGGGCVLEHCDAFDFVRVHLEERPFHSVHKDERGGCRVGQGTCSAHENLRVVSSRLPGGLDCGNSRYGSRQGACCASRRRLEQFFGVD